MRLSEMPLDSSDFRENLVQLARNLRAESGSLSVPQAIEPVAMSLENFRLTKVVTPEQKQEALGRLDNFFELFELVLAELPNPEAQLSLAQWLRENERHFDKVRQLIERGDDLRNQLYWFSISLEDFKRNWPNVTDKFNRVQEEFEFLRAPLMAQASVSSAELSAVLAVIQTVSEALIAGFNGPPTLLSIGAEEARPYSHDTIATVEKSRKRVETYERLKRQLFQLELLSLLH